MKRTIGLCEFRDAFRDMGRGHSFTYEGYEILYNFLCDYEEQCDTEIELDPIAFCCEYEEREIQEIIDEYDIDISDFDYEDDDEVQDFVLDYLNERTTVCGIVPKQGTIIYSSF